MIDVLIKGIGVGLAVAAPVGPIGLLCIKRTLNDGRTTGLAAGLGAATADGVYGMMVAVGLTATGLLVNYAQPMALGGGALICLLGMLSVKAFIDHKTQKAAKTQKNRGIIAAFITTFLLTLSNPMTILTFVGLVAGLGASSSDSPLAPYVLVFGVFAGSALWWLMLVFVTGAARSKMTQNHMRWLDLVSGSILVIWGLWIIMEAI